MDNGASCILLALSESVSDGDGSSGSVTVDSSFDTSELLEAVRECTAVQASLGFIQVLGIFVIVGLLLSRIVWEHMKAG